jgi:hypothetical protein
MAVEKRRFPRASIMCKVSAVFGERILVFNAHTENVSPGGVRLVLEEKLHIPTEVEVELFFPTREKPLKSKGQIAWVKELGPLGTNPRLFDTGIKFIGLSAADKEELEKFVDSSLSHKQQ